MHYTIYKIANKIDGKFYIGCHKTKNLDDTYMGSGKYLHKAIQKYGIQNFEKEILFVFDNPEEMYAKESEIVNEEFLALNNTYNLKVGGFGGWDYINARGFIRNDSHFDIGNKQSILGGTKTFLQKTAIFSEDAKKKAIEVHRERYPNGTFYGKTHTEDTKRKIGTKNSEHQKGTKNSQYGMMWITNETESKKIKNFESIPSGWRRGRKT